MIGAALTCTRTTKPKLRCQATTDAPDIQQPFCPRQLEWHAGDGENTDSRSVSSVSLCSGFERLPRKKVIHSRSPSPLRGDHDPSTPRGSELGHQYSTFEPSAEILAKTTALSDDPEFAIVLAAWPTLSVEVRAEIVRRVKEGALDACAPTT